MRMPSEGELLQLWELGQFRHPIDRALLLCSWARPDLPPDTLASLPLGRINGELLQYFLECGAQRPASSEIVVVISLNQPWSS